MKKKNIDDCDVVLLHIPKTGGSTVKHILLSNDINLCELHADREMNSWASILFDKVIKSDKKVIVTWRDPVETVISQFFFYQQYPHFKVPSSLVEFVETPYLQNSQIHFLTHDRYLEKSAVTRADFDRVFSALSTRPNTFFFSVDHVEESLLKLQDFIGKRLIHDQSARRFNFQKTPTYYYPQTFLSKVRQLNGFDQILWERIVVQLYSTCQVDSFLNIVVKDVPWWFPLIWFVNDVVGLNQHKERLTQLKSEISSRLPCTLSDYLKAWCLRNDATPTSDEALLDRVFTICCEILDDNSPLVWLLTESLGIKGVRTV